MNKYKLLVAVAVAGLLGMSARAAITAFDPVKIKGTILVQTNDTTKGSTTKYNVTKIKVTNKDILKLVENEFEVTFPAGAQLAVDNFWSGEFYVLDKAGAEIQYAGHTYTDDYELYLGHDNNVYTGSDTSKVETDNSISTAEFFYEDATDANRFAIYGLAIVKDTYATQEKESFKITGLAGDGYFAEHDAVVTGTVSGAGDNNDD
jgi:hypothetical protein